MKIEGTRILVTGGAGMIASHILDLLTEEHPKEIIAFDKDISRFKENCSTALHHNNVKTIEGDITRIDDVRKAVKGVDFVVHTASLMGRESTENLRAAFEVNIRGTFNLIEESVASEVKKFIYSSSMNIYGEPLVSPITEEHPFNTSAMYGTGKAASELFLRLWKRSKGLDYIALRYAVVYGPRQHYRGTNSLYIAESFDRIDRGLPPIIYGDGSQSYDYVYVEDVARANVLSLKSPVSGESFTIGTGMSPTVSDVVRMIIETTGTSFEPIYEPQGDRFRLKSIFLDVTKAERVLGFKAEVPMREGLIRYYDWRKKQRKMCHET
jgi:UDP-glucose 4-epimerase